MELSAEIRPDFNGTISITDYTELSQYVDEDDENVLPFYHRFKYSQTRTVNILKLIKVKGESLLNVFFGSHRTESDSMRIPLPEDGYYAIYHVVLPTKEWWEEVKSSSDISYYNNIYVSGLLHIYKVVNGELFIADPLEIIETNPHKTTISICSFLIFSIDRLKHCYANISRKIMDNYVGKCSAISEQDKFNRDFIWMTINVITYYLEWDRYTEAQVVLEDLGCHHFCDEDTGQFKNGRVSCGCKK